MFSLIIVVISVILVGLLAGATLYYLGDDLIYGSRQDALTSRYKNDTEQVFGALTLYRQDLGAYPTDDPQGAPNPLRGVDKLVAGQYLQALPGSATSEEWSISQGVIKFAPQTTSDDVCLSLNKDNGVLNPQGEPYVPACTSAIANTGRVVCCSE